MEAPLPPGPHQPLHLVCQPAALPGGKRAQEGVRPGSEEGQEGHVGDGKGPERAGQGQGLGGSPAPVGGGRGPSLDPGQGPRLQHPVLVHDLLHQLLFLTAQGVELVPGRMRRGGGGRGEARQEEGSRSRGLHTATPPAACSHADTLQGSQAHELLRCQARGGQPPAPSPPPPPRAAKGVSGGPPLQLRPPPRGPLTGTPAALGVGGPGSPGCAPGAPGSPGSAPAPRPAAAGSPPPGRSEARSTAGAAGQVGDLTGLGVATFHPLPSPPLQPPPPAGTPPPTPTPGPIPPHTSHCVVSRQALRSSCWLDSRSR